MPKKPYTRSAPTAPTARRAHFCAVLVLAACGLQAPQLSAQVLPTNLPARELRQLQDDVERGRLRQELREMESRKAQPTTPQKQEAEPPAAGFRLTVNSIGHTPSQVLTDDEFNRTVAPWIGRTIEAHEIADILNAVNEAYRARGYVVCQAVVKPQRIRNGHLEITLIEGRTSKTSVACNDSTNEDFILSAFDFDKGKVANYRDMIDALVRFNMTHDVALKIDISAGDEPMSTAYRIDVTEPPRWTASIFADTVGSKSTGRPRAGASITNRSVLGLRDSFTILGLASEGSKSAMAAYALPLNAYGTKLSASISFGDVEVVDGPSADYDVSGDSYLASLRLEHPVYVSQKARFTLWGEWGRQGSSSSMFGDVTISDTDIDLYTAGVDALVFSDRAYAAGTLALSRHRVEENVFDLSGSYSLLTGSLSARQAFSGGAAVSFNARWQATLGGDALNSTDYFYLGHASGVRGYDNDLIAAEEGLTVSLEAGYPILGEGTWLFGFVDYGRLWGSRTSLEKSLASAGCGLQWPLFDGARLAFTASFPLKRSLADDVHVNSARADLQLVVTW